MNSRSNPDRSTLARLYGLEGRVALVTGAARGIGKAIAALFADLGADVATMDQDKEGNEATAKLIGNLGARSLAVHADVTNHEQVDAAVAAAWDHFGYIDILVNNAGIGLNKTIEDMTSQDWQAVMDVNLNAVFHMSKAVGSRLIARGKGGHIVNIASMSGLIINHPQPQAAYNTSKAGVIHLTRSCASEWAAYGIQVNSISPGYTLTELTRKPSVAMLHDDWKKGIPMNRLAEPEEIAAAVAFLASRASSYITGHNLVVDGGFTIW